MVAAALLLGSSMWVLYDSERIGVRKGLVSGFSDLDPRWWFFGSLLLWIVVFPLYLANRPRLCVLANLPEGDGLAHIERLGNLLVQGGLTQDEFERNKKALNERWARADQQRAELYAAFPTLRFSVAVFACIFFVFFVTAISI